MAETFPLYAERRAKAQAEVRACLISTVFLVLLSVFKCLR